MEKPTLLVLAAGMGSRYGGLKQIDPVGPAGEIILDYSLYDARLAGFERVVFVIKPELEEAFESAIGRSARQHMEVVYAYQTVDSLPEGFTAPAGRVKPWGTGHAVLCARCALPGPFAVINADDYYGRSCFELLYGFLKEQRPPEPLAMCMVGYRLDRTLTDNGSVSRGVCAVEQGLLKTVTEHTSIARASDGSILAQEGENMVALEPDAIVSMNAWGMPAHVFDPLQEGFCAFLRRRDGDALKREYYLPGFVDDMVRQGRGTVQVLQTPDQWHGVTYREDREKVRAAFEEMLERGVYPALRKNGAEG